VSRSVAPIVAGLVAGLLVVVVAASDDAPGLAPQLGHSVRVPLLARDDLPLPSPSPPAATTGFTVDFIDVGQGDATLVTVGDQRLLIDGGRSGNTILQRLQALGVTDLDAVVATHPDADHTGGLTAVLESFAVERIYVNGNSSETQTYAEFLAAAEAEPGAVVSTASRGQAIALGGLSLPVLHPAALTGDTNVDSIVLGLACGSVEVLLMADAEAPSEQSMLAAGLVDDVDVLKVGHHGSNTSSSQAFLDAASPEVAVISAGRTNPYGHPHAEVLARLAGIGASILLTDTTAGDDTLRMTTDCATYAFTLVGSGAPAAPTGVPSAVPTPTATSAAGQCSPSYPTVCIPSPPPDLDCGDVPYDDFAVLPPDPHRFDGDEDGVGCESG
jgi:beta-lactamase superfamily II metal-dependent hydrolase